MAAITLTTPTTEVAVDSSGQSAEAGGDYFVNNGRILFKVENSGGTSRTVTIVSGGTVESSIAIGDISFSVGAGAQKIVGTFPTRYFNDVNGRVSTTYDDATGLTVAAIKCQF